jgi:hypothetical protein
MNNKILDVKINNSVSINELLNIIKEKQKFKLNDLEHRSELAKYLQFKIPDIYHIICNEENNSSEVLRSNSIAVKIYFKIENQWESQYPMYYVEILYGARIRTTISKELENYLMNKMEKQ